MPHWKCNGCDAFDKRDRNNNLNTIVEQEPFSASQKNLGFSARDSQACQARPICAGVPAAAIVFRTCNFGFSSYSYSMKWYSHPKHVDRARVQLVLSTSTKSQVSHGALGLLTQAGIVRHCPWKYALRHCPWLPSKQYPWRWNPVDCLPFAFSQCQQNRGVDRVAFGSNSESSWCRFSEAFA